MKNQLLAFSGGGKKNLLNVWQINYKIVQMDNADNNTLVFGERGLYLFNVFLLSQIVLDKLVLCKNAFFKDFYGLAVFDMFFRFIRE
jgi:hypothetical protein